MAGGEVLVSLAGSVGWGIGGGICGVVGIKNKKVADEAFSEIGKIEEETEKRREQIRKIGMLSREILLLFVNLRQMYFRLLRYAGGDFVQFDENLQTESETMVNNTLALAQMLNETTL